MRKIINRPSSAVLLLLLWCWDGQGFLICQTRVVRPIQGSPRRAAGNPLSLQVQVPRRWLTFPQVQLASSSDNNSGHGEGENDNVRNNNKSSKDILTIFMQSLWKGMTLPFPALRRIVVQPPYKNQNRKMAIGLSFREGLLALIAYLGAGVVAYSVVLEKWSIVDALYFSCVVLTTVGYGDCCPTNPASKAFTCLFGLGGIALLGAAVATVGGRFVQAEVETLQKARRESQRRLLHMFEGMPKVLRHHRGKTRNEQLRALKESREKLKRRLNRPMRAVQLIKQALCRALPSLTIIIGGSAIMRYLNTPAAGAMSWSWGDALYYGVITASTIGLGDLAPSTPAARVFATFYIPLSVAAAGEILSGIAMALVQRRQREVYAKQLEHDLTIQHLQAMDTDGDGQITRFEYVQFMLMEMGRITAEELDELLTQFERLDVTRSGYLDNDDLKLMAELRGANVVAKNPPQSEAS